MTQSFEAALESEWERIRKEEQIGDESFVAPGFHAYEYGIIPLCRFARHYTLTKDPVVLGLADIIAYVLQYDQNSPERKRLSDALTAFQKELEGLKL